MLTTSTLRRLVLGAHSEILDLGRSVRTFPRHLKDALLAAQRSHCGIPHCHVPTTWLHADHIIPYAAGGATATRNGQIICAPDNHHKGTALGPHHNHRHRQPPNTSAPADP